MATFILTAGKKAGAKQTLEINGMATALPVLCAMIALMKNNNNHPAAYIGYWSHLKSRSHVAMGWEDSTHYARIEKKGQ